jgi:PAS domain S-box-containing protein
VAELLSKPTILIVDDQKSNIETLSEILEDYERIISANGIQALEIARSANPPDLILLDIMMPDMDGYEVCQRLKADKETCNIPIIFVTAIKEILDEKHGFEMGAVDYITKPYHPEIIKHRIQTHLELKKQYLELEYIRSLFNYSLDPAISLDAQADIIEFNQAAESTFGYSQKEIFGKSITTLFASPKEVNFVNILFLKNGEFKGELSLINKDGISFPAFMKFAAIRNVEGSITGAVGSIANLTAEKGREIDVVKTTVETMKDVIRNSLHGLQLLRNEASSSVSKESLEAFDESINNVLDHITKMEQLNRLSEIKIGGVKLFDVDGRYTKKAPLPSTAKVSFELNEITPLIAYDSWNRKEVTPIFNKIALLIDNSNGAAFEHFKILKELLYQTELSDELDDLKNSLDRFEFESAKSILVAIAKRLDIHIDSKNI